MFDIEHSIFLSMIPKYEYPPILIAGLTRAVLFGRRRDFHLDSQACIRDLNPPLRVLGEENIPQRGPCLIVMNHYFRLGFHVWWLSMAISSLIPMKHTWLLASEWTAPGQWYEPIKSGISRFVSRRLSEVYGFLRMPPMPPRPQDVEARARAVRNALSYVEHAPNPVLCIAPEGGDMPGGKLSWPPSGVGRFLCLSAERGLPIVPVGGWEEAGALTVRFGAAYPLQVPREAKPDVRDHAAAQIVMKSIACLLPESLRGDFA
ncbi:MAG TPA: 1-acyl-sn-glycerol-3-phosphate acyltransferase [Anaerolineales bacterium]|nr:1-acyl-sn-glycerol-3-phosphate acyltransferase [Anaerolineales bacterium]